MLKYGKVQLDPRTKILFCILINVVIYSYPKKIYLMLFIGFAIILLLYYQEYKTIRSFIFLYIIIYTFQLFNNFIPQILVRLITPTIVSLQMFVPFIIYGSLLIKTSKINDVANVLDQIHCPNALLIPFLVLFRFFPTVGEEVRYISNAMKLRGLNMEIGSIIKKPVKTIEYRYVPILFSMVKAGSELTVASLTRGLGGEKRRTYSYRVSFHWIDFILIILFVALMVISLVFGKVV